MPAKILVVDDHADSRELLIVQLKRMGYDVVEAESGEEGIEKVVAFLPDIVIMDLGLPGISGIEATQRLKQNPYTSHIPVIAHTAWTEDAFRGLGEKAGISEFLIKPTPPNQLQSTIEKWLKLRSN